MAATWTITRLNYRNDEPGYDQVVDEIMFRCEDENALPEPSNVGRYDGSVSLRPFDLSSFTAYDDLTEAQVMGWLESVLSAQARADIETGLAADVAAQGSPRQGRGVPW